MKKKLLAIMSLVLALVIVLASCGGVAPTIAISDDGYWVINGEKTEVLAKGEKGDKGDQGIQGDPGKDATATDDNPQGLAFYLKDDGTYAVEIGNAKYLSKIEIPAIYKGKPVTEVGKFSDSSNLNTILKEITIPDSVTTIGAEAFQGCWGITSIVIPDNVKSIGCAAFFGCINLESITLPFVGGTYLGYIFGANAYYDADYVPTSLKTVIITSGTSIDDGAFYGCSSLTNVVIPDSVTSIGYSAFWNCTGLTSVVIPDSVTSIGYSAFSSCTGLTSVVIGNGVTSIGKSAFEECTGLASVVIGNGVTSIGKYAFEDCTSLKEVYYAGTIEQWCNISFSYYNSNPMYLGDKLHIGGELVTEVVIPDTVETIGEACFQRCIRLKRVTLGKGIQSKDTMDSKGNLVMKDDGTTPKKNVEEIGKFAFYFCKDLETIRYNGTIEEFNRLHVDVSVFLSATLTKVVICSDGEVEYPKLQGQNELPVFEDKSIKD